MLVNLKPFTMDGKPYHYKLGIKSKADSFDQKTKGLISLRPGYHTLIKVVTDITEISENFASLNQATRKCKLSHETEGFQFLRNYTKTGCEFECAAKLAMEICQCLPWYYPNNFTNTGIPRFALLMWGHTQKSTEAKAT